jgi:hypothetical protein
MLTLRYRSARLYPTRVARWLPRAVVSMEVLLGNISVHLLYRPFKGIVCTAKYRHVGATSKLLWRVPEGELNVKKVMIGAASPGDGPPSLADQSSKVLTAFPYLLRHITIVKYDDGTPRRPGWFTVKTMGAQFVINVKDPDSCAQLQVGAMLVDDAFTMVELLLGSDAAPWEPDPFLKRMQPKGGK